MFGNNDEMVDDLATIPGRKLHEKAEKAEDL